MMSFLGRNELLNAFELLDDELGTMGVEADLFVRSCEGSSLRCPPGNHRRRCSIRTIEGSADGRVEGG
jgi:hypothetical protein